ncbi:MAG: bifunctional phosphoribosylaminoimidazolecarboxamide formyltransferase/IMP cyclohydrolase [Planctomycetaceae bacterium]|nr:bifunctional phosphoribosylaminoimidazolecarboxamide formyltransferase/IMP cyclohydrolase [Planctomycetaceae bacterium]
MPGQFPRRALVSVSDKTQLVPFIRGLVELGFEIVSTGGTRRVLIESGLPVIDISEYTGFPEMMEGRVKTLHPRVHGGLLGRPDLAQDAEAMHAHGILPFELVVCNLYPFEATIGKPNVSVAEAIENIDIGGPSMIRSAAKNHAYLAVVTGPYQYDRVLAALRLGAIPAELRRELAAAAFEMTARYDRAIADYMVKLTRKNADEAAPPTGEGQRPAFPAELTLRFQRKFELRYGENPHQAGAFYVETDAPAGSLAAGEQLHGKELSYNNLLDLDAALQLVREFTEPAAVILKHNNPCGAGIGKTLGEAFARAWLGDPVSAFGSILGFNRAVDMAVAEQLCLPDRFIEAIIAPEYTPEAFEALTSRPKWKANVRLIKCPGLGVPRLPIREYRHVSGGLLVQEGDTAADALSDWKVVTARAPTAAERDDLRFAWSVCRHVKSNAIVFAKQGAVIGVGAGQMSRVDSVMIAAHKSQGRAAGGVVASDAFFPFRDGLDLAAKSGISAVIQPGGSRNDAEVIAACNEQNIAMLLTGRRHFKH